MEFQSEEGRILLDEACALILEKGIFGLAGSDGCECANFHIFNVSVEISCTAQKIYVSSASEDWGADGLSRVGALLQKLMNRDEPYELITNENTYDGRAAHNYPDKCPLCRMPKS